MRAVYIVGLLSARPRDKRHKPHRHDVSNSDVARTVVALGHQHQPLRLERITDRNHKSPAGLQLLDERWRNMVRRSGDHDAVKRSFLRPSVVPIRNSYLDILMPERRQTFAGFGPKRLD